MTWVYGDKKKCITLMKHKSLNKIDGHGKTEITVI